MRMSNVQHLRTSAVLAVSVVANVAIAVLPARAEAAPTTLPAQTATSAKLPLGKDDPAIGDYCTILFAPKLQDALKLDVAQRSKCADIDQKLDLMLQRAASGNPNAPVRVNNATILAKRAAHVLDLQGQLVRDLLTVDQDERIRGMFADRTLRAIEVRAAEAHSKFPYAAGVRQATEVALVYTPYGEKPADAPTDHPHHERPQDRTQNARLESPNASATAHTEWLKTDSDHATAGQIQGAADAIRLVLDPNANLQRRGAEWLAKNDVDPGQRENVLAALKLMLNESDGQRRLPFVQAYARWADSTRIADLTEVIDYPEKPQGLSGHETCWAAAMVGLVRLDGDAANRSVDKRIDNFFFRVDTTRFLKPLAEGTGPEKQTAAAIIERLKNPPKR